MYRALYAFRSAEPTALAFAAGETFLVLERSSAHWWLAARARSGETGYVPPAYLRRLQVSAPRPGLRPARAPARPTPERQRAGPPRRRRSEPDPTPRRPRGPGPREPSPPRNAEDPRPVSLGPGPSGTPGPVGPTL